MKFQDDPQTEAELVDELWRMINTMQAMTDRLVLQHEKTKRASLSCSSAKGRQAAARAA